MTRLERAAHVVVRLPARTVLFLVRLYQRYVSPMRPPTCKYYPSCSQYAVIAIGRHGLLRGSALAAWANVRLSSATAWCDSVTHREYVATRSSRLPRAGRRKSRASLRAPA